MNPYIAKILSNISEEIYSKSKNNIYKLLNIKNFTELKTFGFLVKISSDDNAIIISVRGTDLAIAPINKFVDSVAQLLTDLDYSQVIVNDDFRIHQGYWRAIDFIYEDVIKTLVSHGIEKKRLLITGHSAGGAMASVLAFRLHFQGIPAETYVYSAPRVGDSNFAAFFDHSINENPIQIRRFEYGNDPIPVFFPFSPAIAECASPILDLLEMNLPLNLDSYKSSAVEYVHHGPLFFGDREDGALFSSVPLDEFLANQTIDVLEDIASDLFSEIFEENNFNEYKDVPWIEIPKEMMNVKRGIEVVHHIAESISKKKLKKIFADHHIAHFNKILEHFEEE